MAPLYFEYKGNESFLFSKFFLPLHVIFFEDMNNFNQYNIILFSASPRRAELLKSINLDFAVVTGSGDESFLDLMSPNEIAKFIAEKKSHNYKKILSNRDILITADTIVVVDNKILGKPADRNEAICMLQTLSGRDHTVITAYTIRSADKFISSQCHTTVRFKKLSTQEIEYYIDTFKPYDKAGAYGIQEWIGYIGVESIIGSYYNVMGLPVDAIYKDLLDITNNQI